MTLFAPILIALAAAWLGWHLRGLRDRTHLRREPDEHERGSVMEWTDKQIAMLRRLWMTGHTGSQIAAAVGAVSANAVIGKAHRLKLPPRTSPIKYGKTPKPPKPPKPARLDAKFAPRKATRPVPANDPEPVRIDRTRGCRWVTTDAPPHAYCDQPVQHGTSWCPEHRARVFQAGTANRSSGINAYSYNAERVQPTRKRFNKRTDAKWGAV